MARGRDPGFRVIASLTDRFTAPIKNINRGIGEATAKMRALAAAPAAIARSAGLDKIGAAAANVGRSFGNLRNAVASTISPFARLAAIGAGVGLVSLTASSVGLGAELVKLNRQTGWSIEGLQRYGYAAEQSGVETGSFNSSLIKLNKAIAGGRSGNKQLVAAFGSIGLRAADLRNMSAEQIFNRISDAVARMRDPVLKAALAEKLLGKSASEMIAFLEEGSGGIQKLGKDAAVMDDDTAKAAKGFGDTMTKMKQHGKALSYSILKELLPGMNGAATGMDNWLAANRKWLTETITPAVRGMGEGLKAFYEIIKNRVVPIVKTVLGPAWKGLTATIGEGNAVLLAFTGLVAPKIITALFGIAAAFKGLWVALLANPVGAAIVAIALAMGFLGYSIYQERETIAKAWDDAGTTITKGANLVAANIKAAAADAPKSWGEVWESITSKAGTIWNDLATSAKSGAALVGNNIREAGPEIKAEWDFVWGGVKSTFNDATTWLGSWIPSFDWEPIEQQWDDMPAWFSTDLWPQVEGTFRDLGTWFKGWLPEFSSDDITTAWGGLSERFQANVWTPVKSTFSDLAAWVKGWLPEFKSDDIATAWGGLSERFQSDVWTPVKSGFSGISGWVKSWAPDFTSPLSSIPDELRRFLTGPIDWIMQKWNALTAFLSNTVGRIGGLFSSIGGWFGGGGGAAPAGAPTGAAVMPQMPAVAAAAGGTQEVHAGMDVRFANAPAGMRASVQSGGNMDVNLATDYAGNAAAAASY